MANEDRNQGGRPKNVNERQLEEALAPLLARLEAVEAGGSSKEGQPLSRGHFFLHLMTGMCIHRGEAAFNSQFLDTVRNNADDFYEVYAQIVTGSHRKQSTTRTLLDDAQRRLEVIERERADMAARLAEMEAESRALRAGAQIPEEKSKDGT